MRNDGKAKVRGDAHSASGTDTAAETRENAVFDGGLHDRNTVTGVWSARDDAHDRSLHDFEASA